MQMTGHIDTSSLMSLEAYSTWRKVHQADIIAHRRMRSVQLGEHLNIQFESEMTVRYQIQEMLRIEKIFEEEGIRSEIETYAPLMPTGGNWKATVLLEYPNVDDRRMALAQLIGIEDHLYVQVGDFERVYAIADEDLDRENEEKTSAVHFCRWELAEAMCAALTAGALLTVGCDHPHYTEQTVVTGDARTSLLADL
ncbi:hypothetical protein DTO96_102471 [Ephemeroptericola cinctiostellae]|uniref:DUF3501 domain-containing protein n=1 Tax=Ephemeroptericola cinctiostellae TaxID=2268024 RepID=A0A345DEC7_9BURK|nr:DUF3501 family protein [Ephemeroptericola cinctiostellae]AXF86715.1 hypothetical protein DTO96_102471 [Ephemeroptericola cinctiostellae]